MRVDDGADRRLLEAVKRAGNIVLVILTAAATSWFAYDGAPMRHNPAAMVLMALFLVALVLGLAVVNRQPRE